MIGFLSESVSNREGLPVDRFYTPQPLDVAAIELTGPEAHHMTVVLRMKHGQQVALFDGAGTEAVAEIGEIAKRAVVLHVLSTKTVPAPQPAVLLATAVPKGDRFRWLVEKATELGVARLIPLETARSVVEPGGGKLDKMRQTVIAACKQSGRNHLLEVEPLCGWETLLQREFPQHTVLLAHPTGLPLRQRLHTIPADQPILLVVGPEGGFTETEIAAAEAAGAWIVSLGPHILRVETAALAMAACTLLTTSSNDPQTAS